MTTAAFPRTGLAAAAVAVLAAVLLGCGGGASSGASQHTAATPAPSAVPSQASLADWQAKGATEAPPASLLNPSLNGIQVMNETNGGVSDTDARRWAQALLRGTGYEWWAINHMQDQFLIRSGLGNPPQQVFQWDLGNVTGARQAGMKVQGQRLVLRRLVLRSIPQSLQGVFASNLLAWTPYAFFLDEIGPGDLFWVDAQGNKTSKWHVGSGVGSPELVGGQLAKDPVMGDVWVQASDWACATPDSRRTFGALCNP
jgi:hypothetical protein